MLVPFAWARTLKAFYFTNFVSAMGIASMVLYVLYVDTLIILSNHSSGTTGAYFKPNFYLFVGTVFYAFEGSPLVLIIQTTMERAKQRDGTVVPCALSSSP